MNSVGARKRFKYSLVSRYHMRKGGEVHKIVPIITCIILLAFLYLSLPAKFEGGPTGLSTITPAGVMVEREVETALFRSDEVSVIIILREPPSSFAAQAATEPKEEILEERKEQVDTIQDALLARIDEKSDDVPAITGATALEEDYDLEVVHAYETVNALAVNLTWEGLQKLKNDPAVEQILLDRKFKAQLTETVPLIDADDVHNLTINNTRIRGQGEVICIIDTGIDFNHSAFANKTVGGMDYVNEDNSSQDDASNSHGTHVAGIAVGNASSVRGVAPDARIVSVKVCNSAGDCDASDILAGIDYCNNNSVAFNITAISGSLGDNAAHNSTNCPSLFEDALNMSTLLSIIPVFASGNNGFTTGISYPACSPYAISVGSVNDADAHSGFSNRGGDRLDVLAPGEAVVSSVRGGGTGSLTGTSMSTPHVSGTIALIQQNQRVQNKTILTIAQMRQLLKETGKQVGSWHRIDALTAIVQMNHNYTINLTDNSVTNITPPKAKVKFKDTADFSRFVNCSSIRHNFVEIDSINCPQYNRSAHITFDGLAGVSATPLRNGQACPGTICQNITFVNGTLDFDVTEFTNYSGNSSFGTQAVVDGCSVINESTSLTLDVNASGQAGTACFTIAADNLVFNCSGFVVRGNTSIGATLVSIGINATLRRNITIRDCIIANFTQIIRFNGTNDSTIFNNSFLNVRQGGHAIVLNTSGTSTVIHGNTIRAHNIFTTGSDIHAIVLQGANGTLVENNTISTRGPASVNFAFFIFGTGHNRILNNNITTNGTFSNYGIDVQQSRNITISRNNITTNGTADSNYGIFLDVVVNSTVVSNIINTNGTSSAVGIYLLSSSFANVSANNITTRGSAGSNWGINMETFSQNNTVTFNLVRTNGTSDNYGIRVFGNSSFHNISFNNVTTDGSSSDNEVIRLENDANTNTVTSNIVRANGTAGSNGITIRTSRFNNLTQNNISVNSAPGGTDNLGIQITSNNPSSTINNNIFSNIIRTNGTDANYGVYLIFSLYTNVSFNEIVAGGSGANNFGLIIGGSTGNHSIGWNNITTTNGTSNNNAINFNGATGSGGNNFTDNIITTIGQSAHGISGALGVVTFNNVFIRQQINVTDRSSDEWRMNATAVTNNVFINVTLVRNNVTISLVSNGGTVVKSLLPSEVTGFGTPAGQNALNKSLNLSNTTGGAMLNLNISYTDAEVTAANLIESSMRIWRQNTTTGNWSNDSFAFGLYGIDTSANIVFANITNFSVFGAFGASAPGAGPSPGPGGGAGGGGGGSSGPKKEKEKEKTKTEQPLTLPTLPFVNKKQEQQEETQETTQSIEAPAAEADQSLATAAITKDQQTIQKKQIPFKLFAAYMFYGFAFIALVGLSIYWFVLHHRK